MSVLSFSAAFVASKTRSLSKKYIEKTVYGSLWWGSVRGGGECKGGGGDLNPYVMEQVPPFSGREGLKRSDGHGKKKTILCKKPGAPKFC